MFILKFNFLRGRLFERGFYLQIRSIIDIAFFFNTRQAIEKTTNLHYNLFIWMDLRYHFRQLKLIVESSAFAFHLCKAAPFFKQWIKSSSVPSFARSKPQHLNDFMFSLDSWDQASSTDSIIFFWKRASYFHLQ